jgi:hypothetical protein
MITKYRIYNKDIYNFDKIGFLISMLSNTKIITSSERRGRPRTKQSNNREWITIIQGIYTDDWALLPYFVMKDKYHLFP